MRRGCLLLGAALLFANTGARAESLSPSEIDQLRHGATITRNQELERGSRRYVGGVTYTLVDARPDELTVLIEDVRSWRHFLPNTREARLVAATGDDSVVEMTHGTALVNVGYTLRVHRAGNELRFWVDPLRPHDIEDAWGFFRAEPTASGQTLVTYGVLIDMGSGLLRDMFEDRVRALALEVPENLREVALRTSARRSRASR